MCDASTNQDTKVESGSSGFYWNSLSNEVDSVRSPSEISTIETNSITVENGDDADSDDNDYNHDQYLTHSGSSELSPPLVLILYSKTIKSNIFICDRILVGGQQVLIEKGKPKF